MYIYNFKDCTDFCCQLNFKCVNIKLEENDFHFKSEARKCD